MNTNQEFQIVPIQQVKESSTNPRRHFSEQGMQDLIDSVRKHGVLVPLLVRPVDEHLEIIAGARRFRAARTAELKELPVRIKNIGDNEALEIQILENLQREDIHPLEEALGYRALMEKANYDVAAIAAKVAKSESYVYQRLKLTELIKPAQDSFLQDKITAGHAIQIARLQPKDQKEALESCFDNYRRDGNGHPFVVGVRDLANWIQHHIHLDLHAAPFKKDAEFPKVAGSCTLCPKRTGFLPQLFPDIAAKDTCTDPSCYRKKLAAHIENRKLESASTGQKLIELSTSYHAEQGSEALPNSKWTEVKKKDRCEHTVKGIIISGFSDVGKVIDVCADPSCKKHYGRQSYARSPQEIARQIVKSENTRTPTR